MRIRLAFALALVTPLASQPLHATTLAEVRHTLGTLQGQGAITVKVTSVDQQTEGKEKAESRGTFMVEDDGTYIRLVHEKKLVKPPDAKQHGANYGVDAADAIELLNFAPALLKMLEGATLKKESASALDGRPATLLEITLLREKDPDGDKWIKGYEDSLLLWLDAAATPIAMKRTTDIKARIVLIGFELHKRDEVRFQRTGDRLLVATRSTHSTGSGMGQASDGTKTVQLSVVR